MTKYLSVVYRVFVQKWGKKRDFFKGEGYFTNTKRHDEEPKT